MSLQPPKITKADAEWFEQSIKDMKDPEKMAEAKRKGENEKRMADRRKDTGLE